MLEEEVLTREDVEMAEVEREVVVEIGRASCRERVS